MSYEITLKGTTLQAVQYNQPGTFTRRSSSGMKRWMNRQLERDQPPIEVPGILFVQWLKLLKHKSIIVDKL
jgi:hypothetical protein